MRRPFPPQRAISILAMAQPIAKIPRYARVHALRHLLHDENSADQKPPQ
jgi:hypothetical protein